MPIEKGVVNIKLAPLEMECNAKHSTDGDGIDHGTESLMKINTRLLIKSFSNKLSFIPRNRAIEILFDAKNLLPTMFYPGLKGTRDQVSFQMRASYSSCMS